MHLLNTALTLLFASTLLISASPFGRRDVANDNIVWVTVTSAQTVTSTRRRTKTVTFSASLADPPHRARKTSATSIAEASTPAAPIVAAQPTSTTPVPVVQAAPTTPAANPTTPVVAAVVAPTSGSTGTGTFSGQGTFYSAG